MKDAKNSHMLKVHETTTPSGELSPVSLRFDAGVLAIVDAEGSFALPHGALEAVMARFGAPLDGDQSVTRVATLELGDGRILQHVRHLGRFDVIAKDYLVYDAPGQGPLCALATTVSGALGHLARAARRRS